MDRSFIAGWTAWVALAACLCVSCGSDANTPAAHDSDAGAGGSAPGHGDHGAAGGAPSHGAHSDLPPAAPMLPINRWDGDLATAELDDENADPAVVEVNLTADSASIEYLPGSPTMVWAYNDSVPGPVLRAKVGDRVIVHFTNMLPEETTIHWHGVRVPSAMDGTSAAQSPVQPGDSFDYEFTVLDAGTFWYHPHVRSDAQVEQGLYGAIVVEDPAEPLADLPSHVVTLSDVLVDTDTHEIVDDVDARTMMMGREGNIALVNGRRSNVQVPVRAGEPQRLRIVNAASARFFDLMMHGGTMVRVGGDAGLLEAPETVADLLLVNGERADVVIQVDEPGSTATLVAMPYERGLGAGATELIEFVHFVASEEAADSAFELPDTLKPVAEGPAPTGAERMIRLSEEVVHGKVRFLINGAAHPDVPLVTAGLGTGETWTIVNESDMDHPFHLHGFFFRRTNQREWKDTINILGNTTVTLIANFDEREGAAGRWMYHCHIFGHAEHGMMAELAVE